MPIYTNHVEVSLEELTVVEAVVAGSGIGAKCIAQVAAVDVVIAEVLVSPPDCLFDRVAPIGLQVVVEALEPRCR